MNNNTFKNQLEQQAKLKSRSNGIIEAIDREKSSLFKFDGILDPNYDKISRWELERKIQKLKECSSIIEWRQYNEKWELHSANFCRQPDGCPICAKRLQRNRVRRFKDPIIDAAKHFKFSYYLTFTVHNEPSLRTALNDLYDGLKRFRRMGQRRSGGSRSPGEWSKVQAGIISIETKRGENSGLWHPHAHALIFTNEKIDYRANREIEFNGKKIKASKLSTDWNKATLGKSVNIDCRPIFPKMVIIEGKKHFKDVWSQSLEILKYNSKILNSAGKANAADIAAILCAGYAKRKFNTYGAFRDPGSRFYCGPLEPYESEVPEGFTGKPRIYTQRWNLRKEKYSHLYEHKFPQLEEMKRSVWRSLAGQIMGKFRARKYRILKIRSYFQKRGKMDEFDKALENNEKLKLSVLKDSREAITETGLSKKEIRSLFFRSHKRMNHFLTKQQFIDEWFKNIVLKNKKE
jgi:hypothetical protein